MQPWLQGGLACAGSVVLHLLVLGWLAHTWSPDQRPETPSLRVELVLSEGAVEQRPPPPMPRRPDARPPGAEAPAANAPEARPQGADATMPGDPVPAPESGLPAPPALASAEESVARPGRNRMESESSTAAAMAATDARHAGKAGPAGAAGADPVHGALEWRVRQWLDKHRHYPRAAARAGYEGTVLVRFVLRRDGRLRASELVDSSGHALLDRAALELLDRAAPFPPIPGGSGVDEVELVLPIDYRLHAGVSG